MKITCSIFLSLSIATVLSTSASFANASTISATPFTGDADSGVSSALTYTHAFDLAGTGETINGVPFSPGGLTGANYTLSIPNASTFTGNGNSLTGNINQLATDFYYDGNNVAGGTETLTLTNLTPSTTYTFTEYTVPFGGVGGRVINVTDNFGGSLPAFDENAAPGQLLTDVYTTAASGINSTELIINFQALGGNASMHQYGFSNSTAAVPEPSTWLAAGGLLLLAAGDFRRRTKA